jgi:hypothetical protein
MKKHFLKFFLIAFTAITFNINAQTVFNTEKETITVNGDLYHTIIKTDAKTKKVLYTVKTNIPDKKAKEMFYPGSNYARFELVGENIVIVYDIWQKDAGTKDCYIKLMDIKTGNFTVPKLVSSTKLNSVYSSNEIQFKPMYSPDKTKLAIFKDNISPSYQINPELSIYDTKTLNEISKKTFDQKYDGQKRIFDLTNMKMNNNGDLSVVFHHMNAETKMTTKSFTAEIPFNSKEITNIKELNGNSSTDAGDSQTSHGRFYKTLEDYINDKPIQGVRIKNGSFSYNIVGGSKFKLIDEQGNLKKEDTEEFPSEIFTYKGSNFSDPYIMRLVDKKPYIILAAGYYCYYALYIEQQQRFMAEGFDGELKKFKEGRFEDILEKYNLVADYKKDKPKREMRDDVNGYFNKIVNWQIKYFIKLNKAVK